MDKYDRRKKYEQEKRQNADDYMVVHSFFVADLCLTKLIYLLNVSGFDSCIKF